LVSEVPLVQDSSSTSLSPTREFATYLRASAVVSTALSLLSGLVIPALRRHASLGLVVYLEQLSYTTSGVLWVALLLFALRGAYGVARIPRIARWTRWVAVAAAGVVVALLLFAFSISLPPAFSLLVAVAALSVAVAGAFAAFHGPHTRAVAFVVVVFALSAVLRISAWELATVAGERASSSLYATSRGLATAGVLVEGAGQLVAATWIGTRSRITGQLFASIAVSIAFFVTWSAAKGADPGASTVQAMLHTALSEALSLPQPYGVTALAKFLTPCATFLAFVAAFQPKQVGAVVAALSFALFTRGGYDVPMRALAITVAGLWLVLASVDDRAIWDQLMASKATPSPSVPLPSSPEESSPETPSDP
jgi:hypothetical protein